MTPDEIRTSLHHEADNVQSEFVPLLAPSDEEIQHRAVELDIAEIEALTEEQRKHEELVNSPTSDPEKLVRCIDCGKEIPRPEHIPAGKTYICDSCMPF